MQLLSHCLWACASADACRNVLPTSCPILRGFRCLISSLDVDKCGNNGDDLSCFCLFAGGAPQHCTASVWDPWHQDGGTCVFQHFLDTHIPVIFKNDSLIWSLMGGTGRTSLGTSAVAPTGHRIAGEGGSVGVWGGECGEAAGYFGRCKRGAKSFHYPPGCC